MLAMTCGRATGETSGIAFVLALEGEVSVTGRDGSTLVIGNHRVLFDGDRVSTGADAWVLFQFHDGSRLVAGPGARLAIGQRTEARRLRLKWRLESGYLRLFAGLACRESLDDCVIETPYGEARVHAALLDAWLCDSDCARNAAAQLRELGEGGGVDGRVVGLLTDQDVQRRLHRRPSETTVAHLMRTDFATLQLRDTLWVAVREMSLAQLPTLPVVHNNFFHGVVHLEDIDHAWRTSRKHARSRLHPGESVYK